MNSLFLNKCCISTRKKNQLPILLHIILLVTTKKRVTHDKVLVRIYEPYITRKVALQSVDNLGERFI